MKKILLTICACVAFASFLATVSCESKTELVVIPEPALTFSSTSITLDSEASSDCSLTYALTNPTDDGSFSVSATTSWITGLTLDESSKKISFSVSANTGDLRTGTVTLSYTYYGDSGLSLASAKAAVVQYAKDTPSLSVDPTAITAAYRGGTYSFDYEIKNPVSDGVLSCTSSESWISDITDDGAGTVSFTVGKTDEDNLRTATITAKYTYSGGEDSREVTVVQDRLGYGNGLTIDDIIGTYQAEGEALSFSTGLPEHTTWTLTIYRTTSDSLVGIDGLTPWVVGSYPSTQAYIAWASMNSRGQIVIPSQFTGYAVTVNGNAGYLAYTPCTRYVEGTGWYRDLTGPDCVLTYDEDTGIWTSDYGEFIGYANEYGDFSSDSWIAFFDVTNPGFTITKISSSTGSFNGGADSVIDLEQTGDFVDFVPEGMEPHTNFMCE